MIKDIIKSNKFVYRQYQNIRYPKQAIIRSLFNKINNTIKKNQFNGMYFDGKDSWGRVYDSIEYLYVQSKFGGLVGAGKKKWI